MSDDVMERLSSIQPMPRGERLANIAGVFKMTEARRTLMLQWAWRTNALGSRSTVAAILWSLASRALNSENEFARNIVRWRAYAAPLRKAREDRKVLRALFYETVSEMSAEIRTLHTLHSPPTRCPSCEKFTPLPGGWSKARARANAKVQP